jgi:hypothetical protein
MWLRDQIADINDAKCRKCHGQSYVLVVCWPQVYRVAQPRVGFTKGST